MRDYKNQTQVLEDKIIHLERKRNEDFKSLKIQLDETYQEFRPSKLLIRAINDIREEPDVKGNLFESLISLTGGYLSKKIVVGKSHSAVKNLLGYVVQYFTIKIISNNINNKH